MQPFDSLIDRRIIRKNSSTFYAAFRHLPAAKADAVFAVYAFCRFADDAVDNGTGELPQIREELLRFERGEIPNRPFWRRLAVAFRRFPMRLEPFSLMLEGQESDADFRQPATLNALLRYCYLVASSVGLMLLPILSDGVSQELEEAAVDLGIGMQITNILRDVGEDYRIGRIYLPEDIMRQYGYTQRDLSDGSVNPAFIALWESLARLAEEHYDRFLAKVPLFAADSQQLVSLAGLYYRKILDAVRANNYDVFTRRAFVSAREKVKLRFSSPVRKESL